MSETSCIIKLNSNINGGLRKCFFTQAILGIIKNNSKLAIVENESKLAIVENESELDIERNESKLNIVR